MIVWRAWRGAPKIRASSSSVAVPDSSASARVPGRVAVRDDDDPLVDRARALGDHGAQRLAPVDRVALVLDGAHAKAGGAHLRGDGARQPVSPSEPGPPVGEAIDEARPLPPAPYARSNARLPWNASGASEVRIGCGRFSSENASSTNAKRTGINAAR